MINNKQYESTKRELEIIRKNHIIKQKEFHKWAKEAKKDLKNKKKKNYDI